MTHQQILDKLASKHLVAALDEDIARLTFSAMCYAKHGSIDDPFSYLMPKLLCRWNCVLEAPSSEVTDSYKQITTLALCILLHKYGFADEALIERATSAIDALNEGVVLSDAFFKQSKDIKAFIKTAPAALKRLPSIRDSLTFYRARDVISIQMKDKFYAGYVHQITGVNESPVIELYDRIFETRPSMVDLDGIPAKGRRYNDGVERVLLSAICGMRNTPDLANQVHILASEVATVPDNTHLQKSIGIYDVSDLFRLQTDNETLF